MRIAQHRRDAQTLAPLEPRPSAERSGRNRVEARLTALECLEILRRVIVSEAHRTARVCHALQDVMLEDRLETRADPRPVMPTHGCRSVDARQNRRLTRARLRQALHAEPRINRVCDPIGSSLRVYPRNAQPLEGWQVTLKR